MDTVQDNLTRYVERYYYAILKPIWKLCKWDGQKKILTFPNGSFIDFRSAERPENLEGFNYDFIVLNEAGICLKRPQLWLNTIQPMAKRAQVRFVGTPKGKNLFFQLYTRNDPEWQGFRFTAYNSPYWTKEALDAIRREVPAITFSQEYMAEFVDDEASVFHKIHQNIRPIELISAAKPEHHYVMGVDFGKHVDFTVIIGVDIDSHEVVYFDRFNQIDWNFQKQKVYNAWKQLGEPDILVDSTGIGDPVFDDLYRVMGSKLTGYKITNPSKKELIEGLVIALENEQVFYPDIPELIHELELYEYQISRAGIVSYNAPEGYHDDTVIALALAWQQIREPTNKFGFVF